MDRINGERTTDIGSGRRGFRKKDAAAGVAGTELTPLWFNSVQEELLHVIEQAGLIPDANDWTQLYLAIIELIENHTPLVPGVDLSPVYAAITDAIAAAVPPGIIVDFGTDSPPTGWLECNGAAISRTAYAALYAKIGTKWGAGDGSATFNIPDFRGVFRRGWDHGRGYDSGRAFATYQADAFSSHAHTTTVPVRASGTESGATSLYYAEGQSNTMTFTSSAAGSTETRPKNSSTLPAIKY